jgi:predicted RNA-binding protein with RPS1 domain
LPAKVASKAKSGFNLLELDESIQKYLLSIKDAEERNYFTERKLRALAIIKDKNEQINRFRDLAEELRFELNSKFAQLIGREY